MECKYCGMTHFGGGVCHRVRAIEYYPDGSVKRVEFHGYVEALRIETHPAPVLDSPSFTRGNT